MADKLTVRIYNVRFGDAILVTVPDRDPQTGITDHAPHPHRRRQRTQGGGHWRGRR